MLRKTCRDFAESELQPIAGKIDKDGKFPQEKVYIAYCIFVLLPLFASLLCSIYLSMIHSVFVSFIGESFHIVVYISFFVNQFYLVFLHVIFSTYEGLPK